MIGEGVAGTYGGAGDYGGGGGWGREFEEDIITEDPTSYAPQGGIPPSVDVSREGPGGGFWGGLGSLISGAWDAVKPVSLPGWASLLAAPFTMGTSLVAPKVLSGIGSLYDLYKKAEGRGLLPEWTAQEGPLPTQGPGYTGPPNLGRPDYQPFRENILQTPLRAPPGYESPYDQAPQEMRERDVPSNIRATEGEGGYIGRPVSQAIQRLRDNRATTNTPIMPVNVGYGAAYRPQLPAHTPSMDIEAQARPQDTLLQAGTDVGNPLLQRAGMEVKPPVGSWDFGESLGPLLGPEIPLDPGYEERHRDLERDIKSWDDERRLDIFENKSRNTMILKSLLDQLKRDVDPSYTPGGVLFEDDPYSGRPIRKYQGINQGGPVVKQYQDGGPAMADQGIPMEAPGIVASLVDVQRHGSTEDIVGFVQTHRGDLEYLAQINDPRFDIVRSTLIQFGAPAVPPPSPQGSLLPSERIMEETVSTVPGFLGVEDPAFTPGERIKGDVFPPQMQRGGHVGRGTMAGELAPRGSLPVREAGESMYERFKRLHGYDQGGYIGRGTQAGEIMPRGSRSVREEGETMYELAKRREDERNYQGGGPVHHGPSSGVRRLREATLSPSMQRRIF